MPEINNPNTVHLPAIIFDMDGVISETQHATSLIERRVLQDYGVVIDAAEITRRFSGVRDVEWFAIVAKEQEITVDIPAAIERKWTSLLSATDVPIEEVPGAVALIKNLHDHQLRLAVGTSANIPFVDRVLDSLNIRSFFSAIASATEVPLGKPDPAVFLLAAERLGVAPAECVVIEDGISGMQAGRNAGMKVIAFLPDRRYEGTTLPADGQVTALRDITLEMLLALR